MSLVSWFDADALTAADGTAVGTWTDLSASNIPATASGTTQPILHTNVQAGRKGLLFDGVDDGTHYHPNRTDKVSRLSVVRYDGAGSGAAGGPRVWDGYDYSLYVLPTTGSLVLKLTAGTQAGDFRTPAGTITIGGVYLIEIYNDRTNLANIPVMFINGIQQGLTIVAMPSGVLTPSTYINLGAATSAVNGQKAWKGYQFEHRFFDEVLSDTDKATHRSQLINKWGLAGAQSKVFISSEGSSGKIPVLLMTKDTVRGSVALGSIVAAVRRTTGAKQNLGASFALSGGITRRFIRRHLVSSVGLSAGVLPSQPIVEGSTFDGFIGLSGRLIPAIRSRVEHQCRECLKRWAARMLGRFRS